MEKSLGHLFVTSSSSYFFNKTDFERYLYKNVRKKDADEYIAALLYFMN